MQRHGDGEDAEMGKGKKQMRNAKVHKNAKDKQKKILLNLRDSKTSLTKCLKTTVMVPKLYNFTTYPRLFNACEIG